MEPERFDDLARLLARARSRRQFLKVLTGTLVGGVLGMDVAARAARASEVPGGPTLAHNVQNRQFELDQLTKNIHNQQGSGPPQKTCDPPCVGCEVCDTTTGRCVSRCGVCETCDAGTGRCVGSCQACERCEFSTGNCINTCSNCASCVNNVCTGGCPQGQCCHETPFTGGGVCLRPDQCPPGQCSSCLNGTVCCQAPTPDCCPSGCADTSSDAHNCGSLCSDCTAQASGMMCINGQCQCPGNEVPVNGACTCGPCQTLQGNTCVSCQTAGMCCDSSGICVAQSACPGGCCTGGTCGCGIGSGLTCCSGTCVNTTSSNSHCGGCNQPCTVTGTTCQNSQCICTSTGQPPVSGSCSCGGLGGNCTAGSCCGMLTCCGGKCVDTSNDSNHCASPTSPAGSCGIVCPSDTNGQQTCCGGNCVNTTNNDGVFCGPTCKFCHDFQDCGTGNRCYCRNSVCTACIDTGGTCTQADQCCSGVCQPVFMGTGSSCA